MSSRAYYKTVSTFWTLGVPIAVCAVIYYAYNTPGWVGSQVQRVVSPVVNPIVDLINRLF